MERIGLIAGNLDLPVIWAQAAGEEGYQIVCTAVTQEAKVEKLRPVCERVFLYPRGEMDAVIQTFKDAGITKAVMVGKIPKENIFNPENMDDRLKALLSSLEDLTNDSILEAIVSEMEGEGIHIYPQTSFIQRLVPQPGPLTRNFPQEDLLQEMEFGFRMARAIGGLDIGQTVVVKERMVVAAEALEGTDNTIRRAGTLVQGGVVAKIGKPQQDMRFDIPVVGLDTLKVMEESRIRGLVLEAERCAILNQDLFLGRAQEQGMVVYAWKEEP